MSANGNSAARDMDSSSSSLKRKASQAVETDKEEQFDIRAALGLSRNPSGPARFIKKPQPKLFYSETMVRDAMRGELVYTPDLKPLMDSIARDMRSTNQIGGRPLGTNVHYSKMKSILKQSQKEMVTLDRYLLSEAFIRTDIWNTTRLQEFFELVHSYGLEREFRNEYWEKNQLSHPGKIQKLYECIKRPLTHSAFDEALADQILDWAKAIMSRSVFVPRADHPIIRSAVAIMNVAEQQPKDDLQTWNKLQEGPKRVAQIWAAWCLARDKDWAETTYLAVIILERGARNKMVAKCFRRENSALLKLVDKGYDEEACRRWQDMHGRCHVITMQELLSQPDIVSLARASSSASGQQKSSSSASQLQKMTRTAKKTGSNLAKAVPSKTVELPSSSQHQLAPILPTSGQRSPAIQRLSTASSIVRDRTPEDMVRDLQIHDHSHSKRGHRDGTMRRPSEHRETPAQAELDQPPVKKRRTTSFSLGSPLRAHSEIRRNASPAPPPATFNAPATPINSAVSAVAAAPSPAHIPSMAPPAVMMPIPMAAMPAPPPTPTDPTSQWMNQLISANDIANMVAMRLCGGPSSLPFNSQPVTAKTEHEALEKTWTKLEAKLDEKLSPSLRLLDGLSSDVKALADKQTAFEQTIKKYVDDQHKSQSDKQAAFEETLMKKMDALTKLVEDQQTAFQQAVVKMDRQYTALNDKQNAFEQTITEKMDSLSQMVEALQKDHEELKARVDRGQKKRGRSSAIDKTADSITCAPLK